MNPTTDIVEKRVSLLEGVHELGPHHPKPCNRSQSFSPNISNVKALTMSHFVAGCATASGTSANFYAVINCASLGDNIVSAQNLYVRVAANRLLRHRRPCRAQLTCLF